MADWFDNIPTAGTQFAKQELRWSEAQTPRSQVTALERSSDASFEGERSFLDKITESFSRGQKGVLGDLAVYEAMEHPDKEDLTGTIIARKKLQQNAALDPIEGRYLTSLAYRAANTAGTMWEGVKRMGVAELVGATGGAVFGGVVSAIDFIPGDEPLGIVTGATVGASIGAKVAGHGATLSFMYRQGAGAMYADMLEQGINPDTAKAAAKWGAVPYAAVGLAQFKLLGAPVKRILTGKVQALIEDKALKAISKGVSVYAAGLIAGVGGIEAQEIIRIATEKAAKSYQEGGINIDQEFLHESGQRLVGTLTESVKGMALIPIPGALLETGVAFMGARVNREMSSVIKKHDDINTVQVKDVSNPYVQWEMSMSQKLGEALNIDEVSERQAYRSHVMRTQKSGMKAAFMTPEQFKQDYVFHASKTPGLKELKPGTYYDPSDPVRAHSYTNAPWYEGSIYGVKRSDIEPIAGEGAFGTEWVKSGLAVRSGRAHKPDFEIPATEKGSAYEYVKGLQPGTRPDDFTSFQAQYRSKKLLREQEKIRTGERRERLGKEVGEVRATSNASEFTKGVEKTLSGREYTQLGITPLQSIFPTESFNVIRQDIVSNKALKHMEAYNLTKAVERLQYEGGYLRDHELKLARKVLPTNVVSMMEAISDLNKEHKLQPATDLNDFARSLASAGDLSLIFRQNAMQVGAPVQFAKLAAVSAKIAAMSEREFQAWHQDMIFDPVTQIGQQHGLRINKVGGGYTRGSEYFPSKVASRIPGIARTERAFVGGGNYARTQRWSRVYEASKGHATTKQLDDMAKVINILTGEGDAKVLGKYAHTLNSVFFAPRFFFSRLQSVAEVFDPKLSWMARKYLMWNLAKFAGVNMTMLAAMSQVPGVKVERDHKSTDFGKVVIGNTHIDFWGGYLPIMRTVMRLVEGKRKTAGGDVVDADMRDTITRFLQSKLGPLPSAGLDFWKGETFMGAKRDLSNIDDIASEVYEKLTPFFIQDLVDAIHYQGLSAKTAVVGAASFMGVSTATYPMTKSAEVALRRNSLANEVFGASWDKLGPEGQKYMRAKFPDIEVEEEKAKFERDNHYFMATIEKNVFRSQKKMREGMPQDVKQELTSLGVALGGVNKRIGTNWYLSDTRYKQYENAVLKDYQTVLPKLIRSSVWSKLNRTGKVEILKRVTEELKEGERRQIVLEANVEDLQRVEYRRATR